MFDADLNEPQLRIDRLQLFGLIGLMLLGTAFVFSATRDSDAPLIYNQYWFRQVVWYALGLAAAVVLCLVDYHTLARWSFVIYWGMIILLVGVLVPGLGSQRSGAYRWFDLHVFMLQPSEFAKLAFILAQANFLSRPLEELRQARNFWKAIGLMLLPFVLIMKEPDLGSALVLLPMGLAMMFVAGTPGKYLLRLVGCVGVFGALFLVDILFAPDSWQIKLENYQRQRLLVYFGRDFAAKNATPAQKDEARRVQFEKSYQSRQALISVGSGGPLGQGWLKGLSLIHI